MRHLVVPGLSRPWPEGLAPPATPRLDRLLARADLGPGAASGAEALFDRFELPVAARSPAPILWRGLTGQPAPGWVVEVHPVHLRPDRDRLLLFPLPPGDLEPGEAAPFRDRFDAHFGELGLRLHLFAGPHWFVTTEQASRARFTPLEQALTMPLDEAMPAGEEAGAWRRWMNEVQMLFHDLEVNARREAQGRLSVNGLWPASAGRDPGPTGRAPRVVGAPREPLLQGLSALAVEENADDELIYFDDLARAHALGEAQALYRARARLETRLVDLLGGELKLHDAAGHTWHWRPAMRWRFWRRPAWGR